MGGGGGVGDGVGDVSIIGVVGIGAVVLGLISQFICLQMSSFTFRAGRQGVY